MGPMSSLADRLADAVVTVLKDQYPGYWGAKVLDVDGFDLVKVWYWNNGHRYGATLYFESRGLSFANLSAFVDLIKQALVRRGYNPIAQLGVVAGSAFAQIRVWGGKVG